MKFIYFVTSNGGLLGLWNISIYDLQIIVLKIWGKIMSWKINKLINKFLSSIKITNSFNLIGKFAKKVKFKVKFLLKTKVNTFLLQLTLSITTIIIFIIQIISHAKDYLLFESHIVLKVQNPILESMPLPSFKLCSNRLIMSDSELINEIIKFNKSGNFNLHSILFKRREFIEKILIECEVKVEFYEFFDHQIKNVKNFKIMSKSKIIFN
jgi:hypothetical protein